jgi:PIN domain nuclease of toxin-antitoxin system
MLAFLNEEQAASRVESEWLGGEAAMSSINLGEVLYIRIRMAGEETATSEIEKIGRNLDLISPDWSAVASAATVKAGGGLSYADSFCVATALDLSAPLWTGDPEILDLADRLGCETLDLRSD